MTHLKFLPTLYLLALLPTAAFAWERDKPATPPVIPPNPNNLPKVLLIGDSISGGIALDHRPDQRRPEFLQLGHRHYI